MDGPHSINSGPGETSTLSLLASVAERLAHRAIYEGRDAVERELLREVVQGGLATAAGVWARPGAGAPWRQLRGFGGDTPSPDRAELASATSCHSMDEDRCLVAISSLHNHEASSEALELLARLNASLSGGEGR